MLPAKIILVDRSSQLVNEWKSSFAGCADVEPVEGDYFQRAADAIVSPANSFGIMDGGLDLAIRDQLGYAVQQRIQDLIVEKHHGELPVGHAEIVEANHAKWKYMIAAPTMRIPEPVAFTLNSYHAFRAILVSVENHNRQRGTREIASIVCSGLGTGIGGMSAAKCARQMRAAYQAVQLPSQIPSFKAIHDFHNALRLL